jgi:hypothetical protein
MMINKHCTLLYDSVIMVNVKDFVIKLNDTIIIPIERKTSLGVVLEYEYNNECVVYQIETMLMTTVILMVMYKVDEITRRNNNET